MSHLRRQVAAEPLPSEVFTDPIIQLAAVCPLCALAALSPEAALSAISPALRIFNPATSPNAALLAFALSWQHMALIHSVWMRPRLTL